MRVRKEPDLPNGTIEPKRLLNINEAMVYLGIGRSGAMKYLEEIGAKVKIGSRTLYDKWVIDDVISSQHNQSDQSNIEKENL